MNKQIAVIAAVVIIALAGVGFALMNQNKTASTTTNPAVSNTETSTEGNVVTSIKGALSNSMSLECNYTDETGRQTKSYVKNGQVRADITSTKPEESGSMIIKDNKIYFWSVSGAFMMDMPKETTATASSAGSNQGANVMESMEKYKSSCKTAVVADSLFTLPANVTFTDMSKMMQGAGGSNSTSTGTGNANGTMNQEQLQQYMQQYQNSDQGQ